MEEILHQSMPRRSHFSIGFLIIPSGYCSRMFSINSIINQHIEKNIEKKHHKNEGKICMTHALAKIWFVNMAFLATFCPRIPSPFIGRSFRCVETAAGVQGQISQQCAQGDCGRGTWTPLWLSCRDSSGGLGVWVVF